MRRVYFKHEDEAIAPSLRRTGHFLEFDRIQTKKIRVQFSSLALAPAKQQCEGGPMERRFGIQTNSVDQADIKS